MVLTGEKRKEYDKKRYLQNKEKIHETYIQKKGTAEGYTPAEPKQTNKINRPEAYKKDEQPKKIISVNEMNEFIKTELDSKSRRKLNQIYGKDCTNAFIGAFNKVEQQKQIAEEKQKVRDMRAGKVRIVKGNEQSVAP
jgi:hypothetical protein